MAVDGGGADTLDADAVVVIVDVVVEVASFGLVVVPGLVYNPHFRIRGDDVVVNSVPQLRWQRTDKGGLF